MKAILLAIAAGLAWGIGELCTRSVLHGHRIGPLTAIAVRSTIALPVLWLAWYGAVHWWHGEPRPAWHDLPASDLWKLVLGAGVCAGAVGMICFYSALAHGPLSQVKPIAFTVAPATAVGLGWLVLGEPMDWRKALALALITVGVLLLTGAPANAAPAASLVDTPR